LHGIEASSEQYEKGSFLVPFTKDLFIDGSATRIIYDYNLQKGAQANKLLEPLKVRAYQLAPAEIAYHFGSLVDTCALHYLGAAESGGFLSNELLENGEVAELLNNKDFNLFVWPGADDITLQGILSLLSSKDAKAIRNFVSNGGGFVSSCYGSYLASSRVRLPFLPIPIRIPIVFLRLIDSTIFMAFPVVGPIEIEITNQALPVVYGIGNQTKSIYYGGPFFFPGKKSHVFARYRNLTEEIEPSPYLEFIPFVEYLLPDFIKDLWISRALGTPAFITSQFGKGKVIAFSPHPEFRPPTFSQSAGRGKIPEQIRLTHNAFFYATAQGQREVELGNFYKDSYISKFGETVTLLSHKGTRFDEIKGKIEHTKEKILRAHQENFKELSEEADVSDMTTYWILNHCLVYLDRTIATLAEAELIPVVKEEETWIKEEIKELGAGITSRLSEANKIIEETGNLLSSHHDARIEVKRLLKFIPQVYYETTKTSRDLFYRWETRQLLNGSNPSTLQEGFYKLTHGCLTQSDPYYTKYETLAFVFKSKDLAKINVEVFSSKGELVYTYQGKPQFYSLMGKSKNFGISIPLESFKPSSYELILTLETNRGKIVSLRRNFYVNWLDISIKTKQNKDKFEIAGKVQKTWKGANLSAINLTIVIPQLNLNFSLTIDEGEPLKEIIEIPKHKKLNIMANATYLDHLRYQPPTLIEVDHGLDTDYCTAAQKLYNGYGTYKLEWPKKVSLWDKLVDFFSS
jgi:glutamine amidotransferase-like uncharacterized protein/cellobiose-specific phosphotransferase system component IIA